VSKLYTTYRQQQEEVNAYFQAQSSYWKDIYGANNLFAEIYQQRQAATLAWVDELALTPDSQVLEIGCGAGFLSVALAKRGLRVHAIDAAEAMVELARQHAQEVGVAELVTVDTGDVYDLALKDDSFDLVIALGVIPWLAQPELAIREMARVTRFEGHALLTVDNKERLDNLLDPLLNPMIVPVRKWVGGKLKQVGLRRQSPERTEATYHTARFIDHILASTGLTKIKGMTLGFGPFTFLRRKVLSDTRSIVLNQRLQGLADRNIPFFRSTGAHYLVLTRKLVSQTAEEKTSAKFVSGAAKAL
jgi:2-polyprenyl-3-methyl-5-hydroxy-6-metoxy-1,4-benzoquinol methylase